MKNEQLVLAKRPEGLPGDDVFRIEETDVIKPESNELLIESVYISVDPYMRGRMNDTKSYAQPFELDAPLNGHIVGRVIESNADNFKENDIVTGRLSWRKYNTAAADQVRKVSSSDVPLHLYLSTLGMPGHAAYGGLLNIGKPQKGETVVVSAASGAVGSVAGQIAKIKGARVVGIAGGRKKADYLTEELGFDAGVDYKADDFKNQLAEALPEGVDVYFENVGGKVSDEVFKHLNRFARIPVCGTISSYNSKEDDGPRVQSQLVKSQALMQGFLVGQFEDQAEEALKDLSDWVEKGKIKSGVSIAEGFYKLPEAFRNLFTGENFGKQIVKVSDSLD